LIKLIAAQARNQGSGSKKTNAVSQCVQGLLHSFAAIADVKAQLLQSSLMELHSTSLPLGRCLAACILYDERFSKRRVLLQYAHKVEHGRVLMSHETSHPIVPALAQVIGTLCRSRASRRTCSTLAVVTVATCTAAASAVGWKNI